MAEQCSNPGFDDRFTCPACYTDHDGEVTMCRGCGVALECEVEMQPVAKCRLVGGAEE